MSARIDSQLTPLIGDFPRLTASGLAAVRSAGREAIPAGASAGTQGIVQHSLDMRADGRAVRVIEHRPLSEPVSGAVVHIHGGGFVAGSADDPSTRRWCAETSQETGAVVLAVDYRLAPESPFPASLDDCDLVLRWLRENRSELGLDPDAPIVLHGQSAGGALAAGCALRALHEGQPSVSLLMLDAPVTDDRLQTQSIRELNAPVWSRAEATTSWDMYLGPDRDGVPTSPYAAPARAETLAGLPPAFVVVNAVDPLRDEGIDFARALMREGVEVDLRVYARTCHGAGLIGPDTDVGQAINADQRAAIRLALATKGESR